jgi:hypothetical protein
LAPKRRVIARVARHCSIQIFSNRMTGQYTRDSAARPCQRAAPQGPVECSLQGVWRRSSKMTARCLSSDLPETAGSVLVQQTRN